MIKVGFSPVFAKTIRDLPGALQNEVYDKVEMLKNRTNHKSLKVHKLHGVLKGQLSFSVNYKYRIIFEYLDKNTVFLHDIGTHDLYK